LDAGGFAQRIQAHWHIENRLHWPKDSVLKEDTADRTSAMHSIDYFSFSNELALP
jgi:predicted transposase YbfD/YdcC